MFNVTSVGRDEDIYLAELRLLTFVETDRDLYDDVDRRVTVYELGAAGTASSSYQQIASKLIHGRSDGWQTFTVTEAVKRWVRLRTTAQVTDIWFVLWICSVHYQSLMLNADCCNIISTIFYWKWY